MNKVFLYIVAIMSFAIVVTLFVGNTGINTIKLYGWLSALAIVAIPFIVILKAFQSGSSNFFMGAFVGGFLFKLIALLLVVWWAVSIVGFDKLDFSISCLSFLFALQVSEAIYFWGRGKGGKIELEQV